MFSDLSINLKLARNSKIAQSYSNFLKVIIKNHIFLDLQVVTKIK